MSSMEIPIVQKVARSVSNSWNNLSTSPTATFQSPPASFSSAILQRASTTKVLKPFATQDIKVLLLENVNEAGQSILREQGYQVEAIKTSLKEDELIEKIKDVQVLGIRSKTKLTARVLNSAKNLIVIGCFCIGTNQVDLKTAAQLGIAVFNSPFANSRSVAELTISEIIALARQLTDRSAELHNGIWNKVSAGCWEARGKTLGIVGYGHIGAQLSVLSEQMGMQVLYYDVVPLMAMGTAKQVSTLDELLQRSDFVSLHVPETADTKNFFQEAQFAMMKQGSYLINNARGSVVSIPALVNAMRSGKLAGAAIDVYPNEPGGNGDYFNSDLAPWTNDLRTLKNLILTPHIGGSTEEAQSAIGIEVSNSLTQYINAGATTGSVNLPEVSLRNLTIDEPNHARIIFLHRNVPGVLRRVNDVLADHNIDKQMTDSKGEIAYLMADVSDVGVEELKGLWDKLEGLEAKVRTRILY
ncbi:hypothetical protein EG328_003227 [Venturia inaequalis]|uniref:2-oxoglutarate reductase n=1 Tax=Venturia inaequalis TaxID=5025 RepID=A0A8H3YZI1_VENIN|nr:hypothetical protein EG328_003227 [Venturia inaequalis]